MALIINPLICPKCKRLCDAGGNCSNCGHQIPPEKVAELKKQGKIGWAKSILLAASILLIFHFFGPYFFSNNFQPSVVEDCISACEREKTLKDIAKLVSFDPVGFCKSQCRKSGGQCPAKDGSGGPYMGCFLCGSSGGMLCDGSLK